MYIQPSLKVGDFLFRKEIYCFKRQIRRVGLGLLVAKIAGHIITKTLSTLGTKLMNRLPRTRKQMLQK